MVDWGGNSAPGRGLVVGWIQLVSLAVAVASGGTAIWWNLNVRINAMERQLALEQRELESVSNDIEARRDWAEDEVQRLEEKIRARDVRERLNVQGTVLCHLAALIDEHHEATGIHSWNGCQP